MNEPSESRATSPNLPEQLAKVLNEHGYGFHYAVLRQAIALREQGRSAWDFVASEVAVELATKETRVDFVLAKKGCILVAECKRANPSVASWCFVRVPYVSSGWNPKSVHVEEIAYWQSEVRMHATSLPGDHDVYGVALELRSDKKGDAQGSGRGAIEEAATQVIRGLGGLMLRYAGDRNLWSATPGLRFIPAVFTTARLFTSSVDLSEAELETGKVKPGELEPRPWIWYAHPMSASLTPDLSRFADGLGRMPETQFTRHIAIVSVSGIEPFLATAD